VRLASLTAIKIEGDVVEEFLRHTLQFVDHAIVVDYGSLDAGPEIVAQLIAEGLPVTWWDGSVSWLDETQRLEFVRRAFAAFEPEYLFLVDADEFLRAPSRRALEESLSLLRGLHAALPWLTYVPVPGDPAEEPRVLGRVRHRLAREMRPYFKVAVHESFMDHPSATIGRGNHSVVVNGENLALACPFDVRLAHVPVRGERQVQSKALLGWPSSIATGAHETPGNDHHWLRLSERLRQKQDWAHDDFLRSAWHYLEPDDSKGIPEVVFDPIPPVERRYEPEQPEPLELSMAFMRQLALELWRARSTAGR
jgi:hypothetical protein